MTLKPIAIIIYYLFIGVILAIKLPIDSFNILQFLNRAIAKTNETIDKSNMRMMASIEKSIDSNVKKKPQDYKSKKDSVILLEKEICSYLDSLKKLTYDIAGGPHPKDFYKPKRDNSLTIPQKIFISNGVDANKTGIDLVNRLMSFHEELINIIPNDSILSSSINSSLANFPNKKNRTEWLKNKFKYIPVAAVFPILAQLQQEAKIAAFNVLESINLKVEEKKIVYDKRVIQLAPKNTYILRGDKFEADVYLSAYSSDPGDNVSFYANGNREEIVKGVASFEMKLNKLGMHSLESQAKITNEITKEIKTTEAVYKFEVVEHAVSATPTLSNILYIGIDNPIHIISPGIKPNKIKVSVSNSEGAIVSKKGNGDYIVKIIRETKEDELCSITATGQGFSDKQEYKVRYLPDPEAKAGSYKSGNISANKFRSIKKLNAPIEDLPLDLSCKVLGFSVTRITAKGEMERHENVGSTYNVNTSQVSRKAKTGDVYLFQDIKAKCPGDINERTLNPLVLNIK